MSQRFYQKAGVQAAIGGGIFLLIATGITICHQRSQLVQENKRLTKENGDQKEKIQNQERDLIPFKTVAIQWFGGDGPTNLLKLAERVTQIHSELEQKTAEINKLKSSVEELKPSLRLLESRQAKDGDVWVTRLAFGSKVGQVLREFAITVAFDKQYESAKSFVTGEGMVSTGKLQILEGASQARIFRFYGTQLLANNYLVVEFRSKEQLQVVALNLEPKPE